MAEGKLEPRCNAKKKGGIKSASWGGKKRGKNNNKKTLKPQKPQFKKEVSGATTQKEMGKQPY